MKKMLVEVIAPEAGQTESWAHLAPYGKYTYLKPTDDDPLKTGVQLLDSQALKHLVEVFADEVLIDREHLSIVGDDTTAQGWIQQIEVRGDGSEFDHGLWARVKWTDVGLDNLKNRRLRWLSPVWDLAEDNRPVELDSVGLTNLARFKKNLTPVVNKDDQSSTSTPNGGKDETMEKLLEMLGVTTAEEAEARISALLESANQVEALNKEVEELKESTLEAEAEKVATDNEDKIANKDDFKRLYVANKEIAVKMLAALKTPAAAADPVCNKADARPPASFKQAGTKVLNKLEVYNAMPAGAKKAAYLREHALEINDLQNAAD